MKTLTISQDHAIKLIHTMDVLHAAPAKLPSGCHSATIEPGVAMLMEPINNDAFVFVPPNTVFEFDSEPRSGTDHLRQRILAGVFFNQLVENHKTNVARKSAVADLARITFNDIKIYPAKFNGEPRFCVQSESNRGTDRVFGDTMHLTLDEAKHETTMQVRRVQSQAERTAAANAEATAAAAKKEVNNGLTVTERRREAFLDGPTKLHPNAGLGTGTRRESMENAVALGRLVTCAMVRDNAAKNRDIALLDRARRNNNIPNFTNPNLPGMKEINEADARFKSDVYKVAEYRIFEGDNDRGSFREITKIEFDYVKSLEEAALSKIQSDPTSGYNTIRNELAKSWDPKHLDASGKPLPEALENRFDKASGDDREPVRRRPTPFDF